MEEVNGYYCKSERTKKSVEVLNKMANLKIFDSSQYNSCIPLPGFLEYIIQDHNYSTQSPSALPIARSQGTFRKRIILHSLQKRSKKGVFGKFRFRGYKVLAMA